ncbi:hypothetical protein [Desertivirga arenae]|uniref:hypothetical protein n=1 Tax=Desertivirga arenae TaxID=2810309 RepID=UPI001F625364|nr:hypothetical protein [Pedobacter sp. SYSU D00823]
MSNPELVTNRDCHEFTQKKEKVWLGTAFNTRTERFYSKAGWKEVATHGKNEIKFEMTYNDWMEITMG